MKKSEVKYRYALNENDELVEVHSAHDIGGTYHCPQCGKQMICKCGQKNAWHFAHNKAECDYSKYLHTIAEKKLLEWFNTSNDIPIVLRTKEICFKATACKFYHEYLCDEQVDSEKFNLKKYYGHCEMEKSFEINGHKFIPDLFCFPKNEKNDPLFIEICVTHPCETEKINSGIRIIEFVIKSENDIDAIVVNTIKECDRIRLYNFRPKFNCKTPDRFQRYFKKFILLPSKKGYVRNIDCNELKNHRGLIEISIPYDGYDPEFLGEGGFFSIAFAVATRYDNTLKHCCLCKYHVYRDWDGLGMCKLYKKFGTKRDTSDNDARNCSYYRLDEQTIQMRIKEFDDYCRENPVIIWLKPN